MAPGRNRTLPAYWSGGERSPHCAIPALPKTLDLKNWTDLTFYPMHFKEKNTGKEFYLIRVTKEAA